MSSNHSNQFLTSNRILLSVMVMAFLLVSSITSYSLFFERSLEESSEPIKQVFYFETPDEITVSLHGIENEIHQVRIGVSIRVKTKEIEKLIAQRKSDLNSELEKLFTSQSYASMKSREGRLKLRDETYRLVQAMFGNSSGNDVIQAVYFSTFVME